eukprot:TRINITY_DN17696_c0_g1_i1.p1 TRINITY_DN17696_c0_g1~~TRINITY_DN17696_c0_g1_i1.p1  ORF type:complete len:600 (+),score=101.37 TRINITY_DN17696_c0_g1_i1:54-1853(+)
MDISVKEALLKDPRVLEDLTAQGLGALRTPEVQRKIVDICQERFPDEADHTRTTVSSWADDDEVAQKVVEALPNQKTPELIMMIQQYWASLSESVEAFVRAGRTSVKLLAFLGGLFSSVLALLYMGNIVSDIEDPSALLVVFYQFLFGVLTAITQAGPVVFSKVDALQNLQHKVAKQAPFLLTDWGSGLFVFWQGLWWIHEDLGQVVASVEGIYLCVVGVLFILLNFGIGNFGYADPVAIQGRLSTTSSIASRSRRGTRTSSGDVELVSLTSNDAQTTGTGVAGSSASAASAGHSGDGGSGRVSSAGARGSVRFAAGTHGGPPMSAAQSASSAQPSAVPSSDAKPVSPQQPVASPAGKPATQVEPASSVQPSATPAKPVTQMEPASPEPPSASPAKPVTQIATASSVQPAPSPAKPVTQVEPASPEQSAASPAKPATQEQQASPEQPAASPAKPVTHQVETSSSVHPAAPPATAVTQVEPASPVTPATQAQPASLPSSQPTVAAGIQQDMGKAKETEDVKSTGNVAQTGPQPAVTATVEEGVAQPASTSAAPAVDKNAVNTTQPTSETATATTVVKDTGVAKDPLSPPAAVTVNKDVGK